MFDLDLAIAKWRKQMAAGGVCSNRVLDELESHLHDDVDQQIGAGLDAQRAFENAVHHLGPAAALESEFEKIEETNGTPGRASDLFLVMAGVTHNHQNETMNTSSSNLEPRWATCLKAAAFLAPALFLWS